MTLWVHQQAMVDLALSRRYALWGADVGTGKTLAALAYLNTFTGLRLVVAPKPVLDVFREDAERLLGERNVHVLTGTAKQQQVQLNSLRDGIAVTNYDICPRLTFSHLPISAAVIDEAHKIGKYNGTWSLHLARQLAHVPRSVTMTGTPFTDSYTRLYGVCRVMDVRLFPNPRMHPQATVFGHYDDFLDRYTLYTRRNHVPMVYGYQNIDKLAAVVAPFFQRVRADDVLDLPDVVVRNYYADMPPDVAKAYKELRDDAVTTLDDGTDVLAPHLLTRLVRLQQLADSGQLVDDAGVVVRQFDLTARLNLLREVVDSLHSEPLVIFTRYRRDVELVKSLFKPSDVSDLTGDTDTHSEWKQGKTRVLVANISAGGAGVRLERARHTVFWSIGYSATDYTQALGRTRRAGQTAKTVFYHNLLTRDTIDEDIHAAIRAKLADESKLETMIREGVTVDRP